MLHMDRIISYAQTTDGVRIAYWTVGDGDPLVYMAGGPWNHIEVWELAQCQEWYGRLAENRLLVRYDVRGTGLSQRDIPDPSLGGYVADLESVVRALGLDRFDVFAAGDAGPAAISYAVKNPDRVSRLILWCAWARGAEFQTSPRIQAWRGLIDEDWDLMVDTCAHLAFGWDAGAVGRQAAEGFKANITREVAQVALEATIDCDVTALVPQLRVPTLVLHRDKIGWLPADIAFNLASSIPGSQLAILEGDTTAPYLGDMAAPLNIINRFLTDGGVAERQDAPTTNLDQESSSSDNTGPSTRQRTEGVIEILPLYLKDGRLVRYAPDGSDSWQVRLDPAMHPGEVAITELDSLECAPTVIHSTSWRLNDAQLVLTYAAVVSSPISPTSGFRSIAVESQDLAIGTATGAPEAIDVEEVAAHALRHLAWLSQRDEPIGNALGEAWKAALAAYEPEPFSAFDLSGSLSEEDGCLLCTRFSRPLSEFVARSD